MGVLACDRNNCENIMCDRISFKEGYICNECFEELITYGILDDTEIEHFMKTPKKQRVKIDYQEQEIRNYYETKFHSRDW